MKKTAALLAILTLFSTGAFANEKLTLETQGHFAAGGITIQREGTYDNKKFGGWASPIEQGQSYRADHAIVSYQIPARAKNAPLLFIPRLRRVRTLLGDDAGRTRRFLHPDAAQALPRFCHGFARTGARR